MSWKKGQPDPVLLARTRRDAPKKLAQHGGVACLLLLGCLVPLSGLGYPLTAGVCRASVLDWARQREGRFFPRLTAFSLLSDNSASGNLFLDPLMMRGEGGALPAGRTARLLRILRW